MSLSYSTVALVVSLKKGVQPNMEYSYKARSTAGTIFSFCKALGTIAFAYAVHNVVLEIKATIPSHPKKPSKGPMWKGVVVAYIVVAICYFPVAIIGFWMYVITVSDNILISLEKPTWLIVAANLFVVVHVIGSYQIYNCEKENLTPGFPQCANCPFSDGAVSMEELYVLLLKQLSSCCNNFGMTTNKSSIVRDDTLPNLADVLSLLELLASKMRWG